MNYERYVFKSWKPTIFKDGILKIIVINIIIIYHSSIDLVLCICGDSKRVRHIADSLHSDQAAWQQFRFKHSCSMDWEDAAKLQMHHIFIDCLKKYSFDRLWLYNWLLWRLPIGMSLTVKCRRIGSTLVMCLANHISTSL